MKLLFSALLAVVLTTITIAAFAEVPVIADTRIRELLTNDGTRVAITAGLQAKTVHQLKANGSVKTVTRRPTLFHLMAKSPFYLEVKWDNADSTGTKHVYCDTTFNGVEWMDDGVDVAKLEGYPVQCFVKGLVDTFHVVGTAADTLFIDPRTR